MKIIKMSVDKLIDIVAVALMLSFMLGISITNMGEYPYEEAVENYNLVASIIYTVIILFFTYVSYLLSRKRLIIFNTVLFTTALIFSAWYFFATISTIFVPEALISLFSLLTFLLHSQFIGMYYFINPIDPVIYATAVFLICFVMALLSWLLLLSYYGYFDKYRIAHPRKKHLSKVEKMKLEIAADKLSAAQKKRDKKKKEAE